MINLKPLHFDDVDTRNTKFRGFYQSERSGKLYAIYDAPDNTDKYGNVTKGIPCDRPKERKKESPRENY